MAVKKVGQTGMRNGRVKGPTNALEIASFKRGGHDAWIVLVIPVAPVGANLPRDVDAAPAAYTA